MTAQNWASVRRSRDGDQFHYLWAARRCLHLISPTAELVAVTIEGSSTREHSGDDPLPGEQVIDVAEYYGSEDLRAAARVRYLQLKHSTVRQTDRWTPSEMAGTLRGFARRLESLLAVMTPESVAAKVRFRCRQILDDFHIPSSCGLIPSARTAGYNVESYCTP